MTKASSFDPVRLAVIGCGGFGKFLIDTLRTSPSVQIVAAVDTNPQVLAYVQKQFGIRRLYQEERDVFRDDQVEAVHIATPPNKHAELALAALRAGKHVVVEKPLALNIKDARMLMREARRTERILAVNYILRYNPITNLVKELIRAGVLEKLRWFRVENVALQLDPTHWFWDLKQSGGIHLEHGVHFFDLVSYILGTTPVSVDGSLIFRGQQNTEAFAIAQFAQGMIASFNHCFLMPSGHVERTTWLLVWDRGHALIEGWIPLTFTLRGQVDSHEKDLLEKLGCTVHPLPEAPGFIKAQFQVPETKLQTYASQARQLWQEVALGIRTGAAISTDAASAIVSLQMAESASRHQLDLPE